MIRGGTGSQGARGGLGAIDTQTSRAFGWEAFRRRDPGGALVLEGPAPLDPASTAATPIYPWGIGQNQTSAGGSPHFPNAQTLASMAGGTLVDSIYVFAQPLPPGKVIRLVYACTGNAPLTGSIQMGIWKVLGGAGSTNLYPGDLIYDSGAISFAGLGVKSAGAVVGGITLPGSGLYYGGITCDALAAAAGAGGCAAHESLFYPVMGGTIRFGNGEPSYNESWCYGWRAARAFGGSLPAVFPSGARRLVQTAAGGLVPLIFYGFDPE